ncbi:MAG: protein kinase [Planctomycetota bacterium]
MSSDGADWSFGGGDYDRARGPAARGGLQQIGGYRLERELARGGMGAVYLARDVVAGRPVAVKLHLAAERLGDAQRARFEREAQALAKLSHPGIVAIHAYGEEAGCPYLVMDLVEGRSLSDVLRDEGPLLPGRAARMMRDVALAIQHAHDHGVLHRDLKPSNLVLDASDRPRVTDFGLASTADAQRLTRTGQFLGTFGFAPPEQVHYQHERLDARADVFALGATLYALLTGESPGETIDGPLAALHLVLEGRVRPASALRPEVDRRLDAICQRCIEGRPEDRYPSAAALAEDLERWLAGGAVQGSRPDLVRALRRRRRGIVLALLCLPALVVLIWALHAWATATPPPAPERAGGPAPSASQPPAAAPSEDVERALDYPGSAAEALALLPDPVPEAALLEPLTALARALEATELDLLAADDAGREALAPAARGVVARALQTPDADARRLATARAAAQRRLRDEGGLAGVASAPAAPGPGAAPAGSGAEGSAKPAAFAAWLAAAQRDPARVAPLARRRAERVLGWLGEPAPDEHAPAPALSKPWRPRDPAPFRAALLRLARAESAPLAATRWARALARLEGQGALAELCRGVALHGRAFARGVAQLLSSTPIADSPGDVPLELGRARLLHLRGEDDRAQAACSRAAQAAGEDALARREVRVLRARLLIEAERHAVLAGEQAPDDDAELLALHANAVAGVGRREEADRVARRALDLDPREPAAWLERGEVLVALGKLPEAKRALERAAELDPLDPVAVYHLGRAHTDGRERRQALALFDRVVALAPRWVKGYRNRGKLRAALGDLEGALADCDRAVELAPLEPSAWYQRARVRLRRRELEASLSDTRRALELDRDFSQAWSHLGRLHLERGELDEAVRASREALARSDRDTVAMRTIGLVLEQRGQADEALEMWNRQLLIDSKDITGLWRRAQNLLARGRLADGLADLERAAGLEPENSPLHTDLARALRRKGDLSRCVEVLKRVLDREDFVPALIERAAAYVDLRAPDAASADLERALLAAPDDPDALLARGALHLRAGRAQAALDDAERARRQHADRPGSLALIGLAREALGERDAARAALEAYLRQAPQGTQAEAVRQALDRLR